MKWLAVWKMIASVRPAFVLMASAFAYGVQKYGDGSWKNENAGEHIDKAIREIADWRHSLKDWHALVDAALRLAFAIAKIVPEGAEYKK